MSVVKRHWRRFLVAALVLIVGAALLLWSRPAAQAKLEALDLDDGGHATLAEPGEKPRSRVVVIAAPEQQLNDAQMLNLAHDSAARVIQYFPPENSDCRAQQSRLEAVIARLGGKPNLVAGIGPGSTTAWRWLASQDDDKAKALSVGFDIALAERDCDAPLPHQASHGQWLLAWNDNPDDDTAVFVRKQSSAETSISDYDTPLSDVLAHQLRLQLQGNAEALPVLEVPAAQPSDIVTLFYSGDGGWRDLDKDSAEHMASMGYPVVGIDTLRYYWQHKSPEQSAADLSKLMQHYREKWGAKPPGRRREARTAGRPPLRRGLPVPGEEDAPGHPRPRERSRRLIAIKLSPLRRSCPRPTPARLSLPGAFRLASAEPPRIPADPPQSGLPRAEEKEP